MKGIMSKKTSCHLILLGGTGARCGEIFLHMCANGFFRGESVKAEVLKIQETTKKEEAKDMFRYL